MLSRQVPYIHPYMHRAAVEERCKHWVQVPSDAKRREDLNQSVAATLSALGCTYLDLLVIEWPCHWAPGTKDADPSGDGAATWSAMEALVAAGSVKQLGVAHHGLADVEALLDAAKSAKPVVNMLELHPLCSQRKLVGQLLRKAHPPLTPSHQPLPHPLSCTFRQCVCVCYTWAWEALPMRLPCHRCIVGARPRTRELSMPLQFQHATDCGSAAGLSSHLLALNSAAWLPRPRVCWVLEARIAGC